MKPKKTEITGNVVLLKNFSFSSNVAVCGLAIHVRITVIGHEQTSCARRLTRW